MSSGATGLPDPGPSRLAVQSGRLRRPEEPSAAAHDGVGDSRPVILKPDISFLAGVFKARAWCPRESVCPQAPARPQRRPCPLVSPPASYCSPFREFGFAVNSWGQVATCSRWLRGDSAGGSGRGRPREALLSGSERRREPSWRRQGGQTARTRLPRDGTQLPALRPRASAADRARLEGTAQPLPRRRPQASCRRLPCRSEVEGACHPSALQTGAAVCSAPFGAVTHAFSAVT